MAWQFGAVTLNLDEEPNDGDVEFVNPRKWAFANARGLTGRIKQKLYNDAREVHLKLTLTAATKDALQAVYETDTPFTHINPRPPYDSGITMLMTEFSAQWNRTVPGETDGWFDVSMTMIED